MPVDVKVEVKGLEEVQKKMVQVAKDMRGTPALNAMRQATLLVHRSAKQNAPVDTGRLRASITPSVSQSGNTVMGVVGSNVEYAPFQEFGTRHMKGRFYLKRALEQNARRIYSLLSRFVEQVVKK